MRDNPSELLQITFKCVVTTEAREKRERKKWWNGPSLDRRKQDGRGKEEGVEKGDEKIL